MTRTPPDRHALAVISHADRASAAADRAVRRAWRGVLAAVEAGGPWPVAYARAREALRGLEAAAGEIAAAVRRAGAAGRTLAAGRVSRGLLEDEGAVPAGVSALDSLLPAVGDDLIDRILYGSGWLARIGSLTRLAAPDALAARIASSLAVGRAPREIARDILPVVQGVRTSAVRTARTAALYVAHEAELATYEGMGADFVVGYQIHAVLDRATRPEHRRRDGWEYYRRPKKGQRGFEEMPRPPRESPRDGSKWAFNCRCYLTPLLADG